MNWFTKEHIGNSSLEYKQKMVDQDGGCEHAEVDASVVAYVRYEKDSFGPVSSYACCEECDKKADEEEGNELHTCHDCNQDKPRKDGIEWKWYDFYAPQGDEPLFICNCCQKEPKHLQRVETDRRNYEEEFGKDEDNGNDDNGRFDDEEREDDWNEPSNQQPDTPPEEPRTSSIAGWPFPIRG